MQSGVNRSICCILKGAARANKSVELELWLPSFRSKINEQWTESYSKSAANAKFPSCGIYNNYNRNNNNS